MGQGPGQGVCPEGGGMEAGDAGREGHPGPREAAAPWLLFRGSGGGSGPEGVADVQGSGAGGQAQGGSGGDEGWAPVQVPFDPKHARTDTGLGSCSVPHFVPAKEQRLLSANPVPGPSLPFSWRGRGAGLPPRTPWTASRDRAGPGHARDSASFPSPGASRPDDRPLPSGEDSENVQAGREGACQERTPVLDCVSQSYASPGVRGRGFGSWCGRSQHRSPSPQSGGGQGLSGGLPPGCWQPPAPRPTDGGSPGPSGPAPPAVASWRLRPSESS